MRKAFAVAALFVTLPGCSDGAPPPAETHRAVEAAAAPMAAPEFVSVDAPAGLYRQEPSHTTLAFSVTHLGLSNYIMRFTGYSIDLQLDPANLSASTVKVSIDPTSISTDFFADYKGTHPDSPYASWQEELAQNPQILNAAQHPTISFASTRVEPGPDGALRVTGDLTMFGQTREVSLDATLVGATRELMMVGGGALGFSVTGKFKRSDFGMSYLLDPPLIGDEVSLRFEGELHQVLEPPAATDAAAQ